MGLINLFASISLPSFGNLGEVAVKYEWICNIIRWLIGFVGDVGLGIIVFTLILKLITLPLDIYSRASTKKNSLKMEMMKDDLEKLKKQYKNNEQLYQQKMMSLYKKNGYSAFSACLPTIVTLVFFIIVIGAFNQYSRAADKEVFNQMGIAYDTALEDFVDGEEGALIKGDGSEAFVLNLDKAIKEKGFGEYFELIGEDVTNTDSFKFNFEKFLSDPALKNSYKNLSDFIKDGKPNIENVALTDNVNNECHTFIVKQLKLSSEQIESLINQKIIAVQGENYIIASKSAFLNAHSDSAKYFEGEEYELNYSEIFKDPQMQALFEEKSIQFIGSVAINNVGKDYLETEIKHVARIASAKAYEENASKSVIFPWVKNLWVVDSPFKSALPTLDELKTSIGAENMGSLTDEVYKELTYELGEYKQTGFGKGNGLFILVALSILTMVLSTLIMNKQQKTQMQLSSVDGENSTQASTQKMMTWMMPIMFGVFAFIYSAAFSIYMVTSSLLSTGFTVLINLFVERSFKKTIEKMEAEKASKARYGKRRDK